MPQHPKLFFLRGLFLVSVSFVALLPQASFAQSGSWPGSWTQTSEVGNPHVFSWSRTWRCDSSETIMYGADYKLNRTPSQRTQGPMVARGTATPNTFLPPPPQIQCKLWLTKK